MKPILIGLTLLFTTLSANAAQKVVCTQPGVQDASYTATFFLTSKGSRVELFVPEGETGGRVVKNSCTHTPGAIELSLICEIPAGASTRYTVTLGSIGDSRLRASVVLSSAHLTSNPIRLTCK